MPGLRQAIDAHCRACIFDPATPGTWREQVADCASANCRLFDVRPVPRQCVKRGVIQREAVAAVRGKLEAAHSSARAARV